MANLLLFSLSNWFDHIYFLVRKFYIHVSLLLSVLFVSFSWKENYHLFISITHIYLLLELYQNRCTNWISRLEKSTTFTTYTIVMVYTANESIHVNNIGKKKTKNEKATYSNWSLRYNYGHLIGENRFLW